MSMKRLVILLGLCGVAAISCANDGSESSAPSCQTEDCGGADGSGGEAAATSAGGQLGAGGSKSTGGTSSTEGGVALPESGQPGAGNPPVAGASDGGAGGGTPEPPIAACAERSWQTAQPIAGAYYPDGVTKGPTDVVIAGDGSAFIAWLAADSAFKVHVNVSRYEPAKGWELVKFDEWDYVDGPEGGDPDLPPAVAASGNGEAMAMWRGRSGVMSSLYASGWQTPVPVAGLQCGARLTIGADERGDFVAACVDYYGGAVSMARYTRAAGWGPIEAPVVVSQVESLELSTEPHGRALVVWVARSYPPLSYSIAAERFDPNSGWSGPEMLRENAPSTFSSVRGAIGQDGSAAVTWSDGPVGASHPMVRTFSGAWLPAVNLDATAAAGVDTYATAIGTDSHGTFMVAWAEDGAYASQFTPDESWSLRTRLNAPGQGAELAGIAMNESGDAIVSWIERIQNDTSLYAATYSRSTDWTDPTWFDTSNKLGAAPPVIDACGNATLAWGTGRDWQSPLNTMVARRMHSGRWSSSLQLGSSESSLLALALGSNGDVIATSYLPGRYPGEVGGSQSPDAPFTAAILTLPELDLCTGKVCEARPDTTCKSTALLETYDQTGRCGFGRCTYFTHEIPCACQNGACASPPNPRCKDTFTLTTYTVQGTCSPGSCNYAIEDAHCAFGCDSGACNPDPCAGVTCNTPFPAQCTSPSTKDTYAATGTCDSVGECHYDITSTTCPSNTQCKGAGVCTVCKSDYECGPSCSPCGSGKKCKDLGTASQCVQCLSNADCSGATPNCNSVTNVCQAQP